MRIGVFMKIFARRRGEEVLDAVVSSGFRWVHFTLQPFCGEALPREISSELLRAIKQALTQRNLEIASFSGTFNMAHPSEAFRREFLERFEVACHACRHLRGKIVALCTGTRDPQDMWRYHPANATKEAWRDMRTTLEAALLIAEKHDLILAFEPEVNNVVNSLEAACRLLREVPHPRLAVIFDPVNLIDEQGTHVATELFRKAATSLADRIVLAHAKDVINHALPSAGDKPIIDYRQYLRFLCGIRFQGALLIHSVAEKDLPQVTELLYQAALEEGINIQF